MIRADRSVAEQSSPGGERLSITFRFKSNSFDLDSKAWQDVLRSGRRLPAIAGDRKGQFGLQICDRADTS